MLKICTKTWYLSSVRLSIPAFVQIVIPRPHIRIAIESAVSRGVVTFWGEMGGDLGGRWRETFVEAGGQKYKKTTGVLVRWSKLVK